MRTYNIEYSSNNNLKNNNNSCLMKTSQQKLNLLPPPSPSYSHTMPIVDSKVNRLFNETQVSTPTSSSTATTRLANNNSNSNSQSMTTEETRRLTGMVAKTRALFESKENLNGSCSQLNQQQSPSLKSISQFGRSKQNLSNYNLSDYNNQTLQQKFLSAATTNGPKQSFSATNLSSILQKSLDKSNNELNNKENKQQQQQQQPSTPTTPTTPTTPSFNFPKTHIQNSLLRNYKTASNDKLATQNKPTTEHSYLTSILIKPNQQKLETSDSLGSKSTGELSDYKLQNLNNKAVMRKLKKFNVNDDEIVNNENSKEEAIDTPRQSQYLINSQNNTDIVLPTTSVKKVKQNFENLVSNINKFKIQTNSIPINNTSIPTQTTNNKANSINLNLNQDDNTSVSSVSSLSSTSTSLTASSSLSNNQKTDTANFNPNLVNSKFEALKIAAGSSLSSSGSSTSSSSASPIVGTHESIQTAATQSTSTTNVKLELARNFLCNKIPSSYSSASSSLPSSCDTTPRNNDTSKANRVFKFENTLAQLHKEISVGASKPAPVPNLKLVDSNSGDYKQQKVEPYYSRYRNNSDSSTAEQQKVNTSSTAYIQSPRFNNLQKQIDSNQIIPDTRNRLPSVDENNSEEKVNFRTNGTSSYQIHTKHCASVPTPIATPTYQSYVQSKQKVFDNSQSNSLQSSKSNRNRSQSLIDQREVQLSKQETTPVKKVIRSASSAREALLRWCRKMTQEYNIRIENFSSSWGNGLAFCALIHHFLPNEFDYDSLDATDRRRNFELAFKIAEDKAGIVPLLDVEDMMIMGNSPDWKCVFTYVHSIYQRFKEESFKN